MSGLRVIIVGAYPVDGTPHGGVETAVWGLSDGLSEQSGIGEVHVVDIRPQFKTSSREAHGVRVVIASSASVG